MSNLGNQLGQRLTHLALL